MAVRVAKKEVKKFFMGAKLGRLTLSASEKRLLDPKSGERSKTAMGSFSALNNASEASI
jgi:hypothetical protein